MEEDFELISKSELDTLKEENKKLKTGTSSVKGLTQINPKLITEISQLLIEESKKERMFILKNLEEIKELNRQTLNNVLTRAEAMEFKIEDLIENLSKLVETVSEVIKNTPELSKKSQIDEEKENTSQDIKNSITNLNRNIENLNTKFSEVESFMQKLKVLLGQIKPTNLSYSNSQPNNSNPQQPQNTSNNQPPPFKK